MNTEPIDYGNAEEWKKVERFPNSDIWINEWYLVKGIKQRELEVIQEIKELREKCLADVARLAEEFEEWKTKEEEAFEFDLYWCCYPQYWEFNNGDP